jgi:hypothetical protein
MQTAALLATALLFGGMVLFSSGFAAFLFSALPPAAAGKALRQAAGSALLLAYDALSAALLAAIFLSTVPTRQILMPAINAATDAGARRRFQILHGASVAITLAHIAASGYVLARFLDHA